MNALVLCELLSEEQKQQIENGVWVLLSRLCSSYLQRARYKQDVIAHYKDKWPSKSKFKFGCEPWATEPVYHTDALYDPQKEHFIDRLRQADVTNITLVGIIDEGWLLHILKHAKAYGIEVVTQTPALVVVEELLQRKAGQI